MTCDDDVIENELEETLAEVMGLKPIKKKKLIWFKEAKDPDPSKHK